MCKYEYMTLAGNVSLDFCRCNGWVATLYSFYLGIIFNLVVICQHLESLQYSLCNTDNRMFTIAVFYNHKFVEF